MVEKEKILLSFILNPIRIIDCRRINGGIAMSRLKKLRKYTDTALRNAMDDPDLSFVW